MFIQPRPCRSHPSSGNILNHPGGGGSDPTLRWAAPLSLPRVRETRGEPCQPGHASSIASERAVTRARTECRGCWFRVPL